MIIYRIITKLMFVISSKAWIVGQCWCKPKLIRIKDVEYYAYKKMK